MFTERELEIIRSALHDARTAAHRNGLPTVYNELTALIGKATLASALHKKRRDKARDVADEIEEFDEQCSEAEYTDTESAWSLLTKAKHALRACAKA